MNRKAAVISLPLLLLFSAALAHPAHVSMAEMEWKPAIRTLEISLKIAPEELEVALSRFAGRNSTLANTQGLDEVLRELMTARFSLVPEHGKPLTLNWVGYEISHQAAWLYFEFRVGEQQTAFRLSNRLLLEQRPRQVNTVNLKAGDRRQTFRFHRDLREAAMTLPLDKSGD